MPKQPSRKSAVAGATSGEVQVQKSPAEFFAENQAIAGFDNLGKSLYTSLRELMENALDACESVGELPVISCSITEYTEREFNQLTGISTSPRQTAVDNELFESKKKKPRIGSKGSRKSHLPHSEDKDEVKPSAETGNETKHATSSGADEATKKEDTGDENKTKRGKRASQEGYFLLIVKDNGCGMSHHAIPNLLGRVLSGSKYGVRQTRGKFGLGAKMALIWSKKSTGQPIKVTTSHRPDGGPPATHVSTCHLDIDIYKNSPRILEHSQEPNTDGWVGTQVEVLIAGNWTTYKSRIVQYLQQLAIITPYAVLELTYRNESDPKRNMNIRYDRRSEQMPPPAREVKHHPSSVNNLVIQHLVQLTRCKTLHKFLSTELASVSPALAKRLLAELGTGFDESMSPSDLSNKKITRLVQLLRQVQLFKAPDGSCLSPLGEYNLNLGIRKVLEPDLIATARDRPGAYEGHPFQVEAAVSLGGRDVREGITVVRFANRIPLLFEGGADVSTRVAHTKIRWSNYKIDHKKDRVGVFVSIVSTKVPFKGTSKEYIGDDATEIQLSVKRALQSCCQQLRAHLTKRNALKDAKERKSRLARYIPDVGRSLFGILDGMRKRRASQRRNDNEGGGASSSSSSSSSPAAKRLRLDEKAAREMIAKLDRGQVTEGDIEKSLRATIEEGDEEPADGTTTANGKKSSGSRRSSGVQSHSAAASVPVPLFLVPLYNLDDPQHDVVCPPLFTFRPIRPIGGPRNL